MQKLLSRKYGKLPGPGTGPTDISKLGPKIVPPHITKNTQNSAYSQPQAASNVIKPPIVGGPNSNNSVETASLSENNWQNSSILEKIDPSIVPVKKGVQFLWTGGAGASSEKTEQSLLEEAQQYGLVVFEETSDKTDLFDNKNGGPKLTKLGLTSYTAHANPKIINKDEILATSKDIVSKEDSSKEDVKDKDVASKEDSSKEDVKDKDVASKEDSSKEDVKDVKDVKDGKIFIPFKSGLLASHSSNVLLLPSQTHMAIIYCPQKSKYIGIGLLTSQKSCVFLSPVQIYNQEKKQFFRLFNRPKLVDEKDFQENPVATIFVNQQHIQGSLGDMAQEFLEKSSEIEIYDTKTVTPEMLKTMIDAEKNKETNKETKAQSVGHAKNKDTDLNENKDTYTSND